MSSRKKREAEFQYYEIPHGERLLALPNQRVAWDYGNIQESDKRHFHNLLEIGCCISGSGRIFFQSHAIDYGPGMITVIPQNITWNGEPDAYREPLGLFLYKSGRPASGILSGQSVVCETYFRTGK